MIYGLGDTPLKKFRGDNGRERVDGWKKKKRKDKREINWSAILKVFTLLSVEFITIREWIASYEDLSHLSRKPFGHTVPRRKAKPFGLTSSEGSRWPRWNSSRKDISFVKSRGMIFSFFVFFRYHLMGLWRIGGMLSRSRDPRWISKNLNITLLIEYFIACPEQIKLFENLFYDESDLLANRRWKPWVTLGKWGYSTLPGD